MSFTTLDQGVPEASLLSTIRSSVSALLRTMQKREPTIYTIGAFEDSDLVTQVSNRLKAVGIRWVGGGVFAGKKSWEEQNMMQRLEREMSAADFVLFFISPHSAWDRLTTPELKVALHRQISGEGGAVILPVMIEDTDDADLLPLLRQYSWIDLRGDNFEEGVRDLVKAIHGASGTRDPCQSS